jgi:integrase
MACLSKRRGKWVVDYRVHNGPDGRRTPGFDTKSEAEAFLRDLRLRPIDQMIGYKPVIEKDLKVATEEYLNRVTVKKAPKTYHVDKISLTGLAGYFSKRLLSEVSFFEIESYQLGLVKNLNPATVNRRFNVIKNFFKKTVEWGYLRENPCQRITKLRETTTRKVILSAEQTQTLIENLPDWAANAFYFIAKTGIRRGEVCSLAWTDVDFTRKLVFVRSIKGGREKIRPIPMTDEVYLFLLKKWNQRQKKLQKSDYVFYGSDGDRIKPMSLTQAVTRLRGVLNIPNAGLHILRHSIITKMAEADSNGSMIQSLAGHASLQTTQLYMHHGSEQLRQTLEAFEYKEDIKPKGFVREFGS